jgi:hypothetical protein
MPIKPRDVGDKDGIDLYRSVMKSKTTREMERENLPKEAVYRDVPPFGKFLYDVIRRGTCVVHQLPIHHFPSNVRVSSGDPEEIFAGFVYEDFRTQNVTTRMSKSGAATSLCTQWGMTHAAPSS